MLRAVLPFVALVATMFSHAADAATWRLSIPNAAVKLSSAATSEGQIAVIAPGANTTCLGGRVLTSSDWQRPGTTHGSAVNTIIRWKDLGDGSEGNGTVNALDASFDNLVFYGTNDHTLLALPNGHVVYQIGSWLKTTISDKPWWFDFTKRDFTSGGFFGFGARSGIATWISTDCGSTFAPVKIIDAYFNKDDKCANPQPRYVPDPGDIDPATGQPKAKPSLSQPFDMGGTDGPRVVYDRISKQLLTTEGCFGFERGKDVIVGHTSEPTLGAALQLNYVFASKDEGTTWNPVVVDTSWGRYWRTDIVPIDQKRIAINRGTGILLGELQTDGTYKVTRFEVDGLVWGWPDGQDTAVIKDAISANFWAQTQLSRAPGDANAVLMFVPANHKLTSTCHKELVPTPKPPFNFKEVCRYAKGFRVYRFNATTKKFDELEPILPVGADGKPDPDRLMVHLTVSDAGEGPILAHWYDVDAKSGNAIVRGQVYFSATETKDVLLSRDAGGAPRPVFLRSTGADGKVLFLGDYKGGAAYKSEHPLFTGGGPTKPPKVSSFHFFPMWVEPQPLASGGSDFRAFYTHVTVWRDVFAISAVPKLAELSSVQVQPRMLRQTRVAGVKINPARVRPPVDAVRVMPVNVGTRKYKIFAD